MDVEVAVGGGGLEGVTVGTVVAVLAGGGEVGVSRGGTGGGVGLGETAVGEATTGGVAVSVGVELGWGVGVWVARANTGRVLGGVGVASGAPGPHWVPRIPAKLTEIRNSARVRMVSGRMDSLQVAVVALRTR